MGIAYPAFKAAYEKLREQVLKKEQFIEKFEDLLGPDHAEGEKKIPYELLEYICQNCQPKPSLQEPDKPVDNLTADEIEYVLSLVALAFCECLEFCRVFFFCAARSSLRSASGKHV